MSDFAPVFEGWNVWTLHQVKDLPFNPLMIGVSRDRQLRIWVEDALREHGFDVADPLNLKGGQIEILPSAPRDLAVAMRKEEVGGSAMVLDGPAELRTVRFYNRGGAASLPWPHDGSYLLETVLKPSPSSPATSAPAPSTVGGSITPSAPSSMTLAVGAFALLGVLLLVNQLRR